MSLRTEQDAVNTKIAQILRSHEHRLRELELNALEMLPTVKMGTNTTGPIPDKKIYRKDGTLACAILFSWANPTTASVKSMQHFSPFLQSITREFYAKDGITVLRREVLSLVGTKKPSTVTEFSVTSTTNFSKALDGTL